MRPSQFAYNLSRPDPADLDLGFGRSLDVDDGGDPMSIDDLEGSVSGASGNPELEHRLMLKDEGINLLDEPKNQYIPTNGKPVGAQQLRPLLHRGSALQALETRWPVDRHPIPGRPVGCLGDVRLRNSLHQAT